ncbi:uncharacterized protein C8Q71DRAFT_528973 [Rhodofomes roseus]|uniref:Uncharacterized protein n=1 Tax=Rhodofomes roseus TaxID=34475 RepID=A0ABQ8KJX0_9APHY|nr:uncharacterized protein C8Q71DRAFT_528973 [Rhodofomes roseus]KAH9838415.1 hypothetical protein C8Q71DRAFT_528973 [Rhodofomes roseus]
MPVIPTPGCVNSIHLIGSLVSEESQVPLTWNAGPVRGLLAMADAPYARRRYRANVCQVACLTTQRHQHSWVTLCHMACSLLKTDASMASHAGRIIFTSGVQTFTTLTQGYGWGHYCIAESSGGRASRIAREDLLPSQSRVVCSTSCERGPADTHKRNSLPGLVRRLTSWILQRLNVHGGSGCQCMQPKHRSPTNDELPCSSACLCDGAVPTSASILRRRCG